MILLRILFNFFISGSALILGAVFMYNSHYVQPIYRHNIDFGAIILAILCLLLAWRFDRSRVIYTLQLLILSSLAGRYLSDSWHNIFTAALFVNLSFVAVIRERGIHSLRGVVICSLPFIQAAGLHFLLQHEGMRLNAFLNTSLLNLPESISVFPETILLLIFTALIVQLIRFIRYPNPLEGALFWTVVAVSMASFQPGILQTTFLYAAAVLGILLSFVEMTYTLAYKDELTGVPGRRALMEAFRKLGGNYSIAMVDIDFFKKFNDKYGHDIGDQVLKMVAARLAKCSGGGRAYRYGGEEFCVVFPGKESEECLDHLEALRASIGEQPFTFRKLSRPIKKPKTAAKKKKQNSVTVTVSIGVAEKTALYNQPEVVMKRADMALYRAKESGRNRVCS